MLSVRKAVFGCAAMCMAFASTSGWAAQAKNKPDVFQWGAAPIIRIAAGSEESMHVEYPSVYRVGDTYQMLYSAYGDDGRWRIKLAISQQDDNFIKQGNIFDESKLPFSGGYAFPFVRQVENKGVKSWELVFSAREDGHPSYSSVYRASSTNGLQWTAPVKIITDSALDPVVMSRNKKTYIVYTSVSNGKNTIKSAEILADGSAAKAQTVFVPRTGIYTLGLVHVDGKAIILVELGKAWDAMCFNAAGKLTPASKQYVYSFEKQSQPVWDGLKYGMYFMEGETTPLIYYNAIEAHGTEQGGQIAVGRYDPDALRRRLDLKKCH